ncbi:MFS transporter [Hysterangium stoloniferum]|nr:MFS transporter [Hysterangium stoloniferum]
MSTRGRRDSKDLESLHESPAKLESGPSSIAQNDEEENRLKRKLDLRIIPSSCLIYLLSFLDRANIGNAKVLNHDTHNSLSDNLHLVGNQYTVALMVFYLAYTIFEVPSNVMLKKFRPSRWIAFLMFTWGALTMGIGGVSNYGGLVALRFFLGAAEAYVHPGLVYFLTFWYRPSERSLRVALILASSTLAGAFGGSIAFGVGKLNLSHGLEGWRWLFLVDGAPSCVCAIFVLLWFPDWPETAGWLTEPERELATCRLNGQASQGFSKVTKKEMLNTLTDWRLYGHYVAYLCIAVPFGSLSLFSPTIVSGLGYEGLNAQLFTVPPYVCAYIVTLLVSFLADRYNARSLYSMSCMAIAAIAFLVQGFLPQKAYVARYVLLCVATSGSFAGIPPLLGWISSNLHSTGAAGLAIAMNVSFAGPGQIIGVWIYKADEAPGYNTGHLTNFGMLLFGTVVVLILRIVYVRRNSRLPEHARKWML